MRDKRSARDGAASPLVAAAVGGITQTEKQQLAAAVRTLVLREDMRITAKDAGHRSRVTRRRTS